MQIETKQRHEARKPSDADRYAGRRLRKARHEAGLTQDALAQRLGITFQQIQKYEAGQSRLSAGRLRDIAIALEKPITWFYEPMPVQDAAGPHEDIMLRDTARRLIAEMHDPADLQVAIEVLSALSRSGR
jgi:transcriptional regulator with XRE-family HTH domain